MKHFSRVGPRGRSFPVTAITRAIKVRGKEARVKKAGRGKFGLAWAGLRTNRITLAAPHFCGVFLVGDCVAYWWIAQSDPLGRLRQGSARAPSECGPGRGSR